MDITTIKDPIMLLILLDLEVTWPLIPTTERHEIACCRLFYAGKLIRLVGPSGYSYRKSETC